MLVLSVLSAVAKAALHGVFLIQFYACFTIIVKLPICDVRRCIPETNM